MKNKPRKGLFFLPKQKRTKEHMLCAQLARKRIRHARNALPVCDSMQTKQVAEQSNAQQCGDENSIGDQHTNKRESPYTFFV